MRILLFTILGLLLGLVLGIAGPIGVSLFFAWLEDFKPGAGAGTAFAIMLPFTALAGACFGSIVGYRRGKTGSWFASRPNGESKSLLQLILDPLPLTDETIHEFAHLSNDSKYILDKRHALLEAAEQRYRSQVDAGNILTLIILSVLIPFIGLPLAIGLAAKRHYLRKRISTAKDAWSQQQLES